MLVALGERLAGTVFCREEVHPVAAAVLRIVSSLFVVAGSRL